MTNEHFDSDDARRLLSCLDATSEWTLRSTEAATRTVQARIGPSRARPVHTQYDGRESNAQLELTVPSPKGGVGEALVIDAFDSALTTAEGQFVTQLGAAHRRHASTACRRYFEPLADPMLIASGEVPADFDQTALQSEIGRLHSTTLQVDQLHRDLWTLLAA